MLDKGFIKKEIKLNSWKILIAAAALIFFAFFLILTFPHYPEAQLTELLGQRFQEYFADHPLFAFHLIDRWFTNLFQVGAVLAILLGMEIFARELEVGTLDFILAAPLSRRQIFWEKNIISLILIFLLLLLATIFLMILLIVARYQFTAYRLLIIAAIFSLLAWIPFSLAQLISLFLDDRAKSGILAAVLYFGFILLTGQPLDWVISEQFDWLVSYYFAGVFPFFQVVTILGLTAALLAAAWVRFKSRDF